MHASPAATREPRGRTPALPQTPPRRSLRWATPAILLLLTGCASVTTGSRQTLLVQTTNDIGPVESALCDLTSDKGSWQVQTPGTVAVDLSYQDLHARCTAAGHATGVMAFKSTTKPMAFGNVLVGGLIGATIDISSGAAYQYPSQLTIELTRIAGTAPASAAPLAVPATAVRAFRAGDQFSYVIEDQFTRVQRQAVATVAQADAQAVRFAESGRIEQPGSRRPVLRAPMLGDLDALEPADGWLPQLPRLGMTWALEYVAGDEAPSSRLSLTGQVMRRERLTTPAGTFDTWAIQYKGTAYRAGGAAMVAHPTELRLWVDAASRLVVKFESNLRGGAGSQAGRPSRERLELVRITQSAATD